MYDLCKILYFYIKLLFWYGKETINLDCKRINHDHRLNVSRYGFLYYVEEKERGEGRERERESRVTIIFNYKQFYKNCHQ